MPEGRLLRDTLSGDMKERVQAFEARCGDLMKKFDRRVIIHTEKTVQKLQDGKIGTPSLKQLQTLRANLGCPLYQLSAMKKSSNG